MLVIALALAAAPADGATLAELQRLTQQMQDSIGRGDPSVYAIYLDPQVRYINENNEVWDKARFLADLKPLPAGIIGTSHVEQFAGTVFGDWATTTFIAQEHVSVEGQPIHTRFRVGTTWHRTTAGWRIVQEQDFAILGDPPARPLTGAQLAGYAGRYRLGTIDATIRVDGDHLVAERPGRPPVTYRAEVPDLFFAAGAPRTRRVFLRDASGAVIGFADRREGEDVVWRRVP